MRAILKESAKGFTKSRKFTSKVSLRKEKILIVTVGRNGVVQMESLVSHENVNCLLICDTGQVLLE